MRRAKVVAVMIYLVLGLLGGAKADEENKKTIVSFNHRFEIPGGQVLPAGKYVFKVLDPAANPNIIQILSEDEKHLYATIMAIPKYRLRQTDKTVMTFSSRTRDRKSTRLNSSHVSISYAVFCLKKKKKKT